MWGGLCFCCTDDSRRHQAVEDLDVERMRAVKSAKYSQEPRGTRAMYEYSDEPEAEEECEHDPDAADIEEELEELDEEPETVEEACASQEVKPMAYWGGSPLPSPQPSPREVVEQPQAVLTFLLPDMSEKPVVFKCKTLGVGFMKTTPLCVGQLKPGGYGEKLGVQPGWELKAINGQDVLDLPAKECSKAVSMAIAMLPKTLNKA